MPDTRRPIPELRVARDDHGAPEIFRSVQGEGPMAGRERTFIRLSGCNLHCVWCDTAYTWNWLGAPFAHESGVQHDPSREMSRLSVTDAAALVAALPSEGLVVTGGEPLMQMSAVVAMIAVVKLTAPTMRIEFETNGTIAPSDALAARTDLFVVSPKLAHSGNDAAVALKPEPLAAFAALDKAVFKFVARTVDDLEEIAALAARFAIAPERIFIMPEGVTSEALDARAQFLAPAAAARGYAFTDRLHIRRFGARRAI